MRTLATTAALCVRDEEAQVECKLAKVQYIVREDETFYYTIEPLYKVTDLLEPPLFQGIPGVNLDLRRPVYIRENRTPVLISERSPAENREDLYELLDEVGMDHLDRLEWLIRTTTHYGGDPMYFRRWTEDDELRVAPFEKLPEEERNPARRILAALCQGVDVAGDSFCSNDANRDTVYHLARFLCLKAGGRGKKAEWSARGGIQGKAGRKRIAVYDSLLAETLVSYDAGEITAAQAAGALGLSVPTFYRRLREWRKSPKAEMLPQDGGSG